MISLQGDNYLPFTKEEIVKDVSSYMYVDMYV